MTASATPRDSDSPHPPNSPHAPALTIVLTGRNDGYGGGDFTARFFRTLRFNHDHLREAGVSHEIVLVEWAPPSDRPHLIDLLAEALPDVAAHAVRSYLVDPSYHEACTLNPRLAYLEYMAKNVGIRRARGAMVLATNTDIYLGRGIVMAMAGGTLGAGALYRAPRVDVKLGTDESRVDWSMLEDERNQHPPRGYRPPLYSGATGDFVLLDRDSFQALRGFNEVYRLARVGIDVNFLVKAYASGYPIRDVGAPVYHTNHAGSYQMAKGAASEDAAAASWGSAWPSRTIVYENPEGWGLGAAPERVMRESVTWLDFDWRAVPPLVDLRRIVLPAARSGQKEIEES
jgi:hypothetical protein